MKKPPFLSGTGILVCALFIWPLSVCAQASSLNVNKEALVFSAVRGTVSRPDTVQIGRGGGSLKVTVKIKGKMGQSFQLRSPHSGQTTIGKMTKFILVFSPQPSFTGVAIAKLEVRNASGMKIREIALRGLSLKGLEGANEPTLGSVLEALGYRVNPGWAGLANDESPEPHGEEVPAKAFRKSGKKDVEFLPVARFSPDYKLPFGFYTNSAQGPMLHELGALLKADSLPQHQTLFPGMDAPVHTFDPGESFFGFYATSPTHTSYTADDWNLLLNPGKAQHATRVYPAKDENGNPLPDTYILCFEEAQNGDYQDYVFVARNLRPVGEDEEYTSLLNGKDLDGWDIFLQKNGLNDDPEHNFSVEDSAVHVGGKYLGYIRTKKSFTNYHFKVDFKWGEKKWPPRENARRDGGICYNIPDNEPDSIWPKSIECQIQEGDVGDFWLLSFSTIEVDGIANKPSNHTRIIKKKDAEKPGGEWNEVEVISYNGRCIQIVNGVVVNDGNNASIQHGRILLQSEFSEIFYKNARISRL